MFSREILLRDVIPDDLPIFFEQMQDPDANWMAAFTAKDPTDRSVFMAHWAKNLTDQSNITQTICCDHQVAGHVAKFEQGGEAEVTYWLGKPWWGQGIATWALTAFLEIVTERPLYARAAKDNVGSIRVLEKCGFVTIGEDRGDSNARGTEVEEYLLRLQSPTQSLPK